MFQTVLYFLFYCFVFCVYRFKHHVISVNGLWTLVINALIIMFMEAVNTVIEKVSFVAYHASNI